MSSSTTRRARPTSRAPPRRPGITWSGWWTRAAAGASRSRRDRPLGAPRARPLRVRVAADHELLALDALDLAPLGAAAAQVARVGPLRDHSLQARLAGGVQERRAVALDVVGVAHRSGRRQELAEERLAVGEREAAEIPPEEGQPGPRGTSSTSVGSMSGKLAGARRTRGRVASRRGVRMGGAAW